MPDREYRGKTSTGQVYIIPKSEHIKFDYQTIAIGGLVVVDTSTVSQIDQWISVKEELPERSECWERYNVVVLRSHFPTSSYDLCDAPYDEVLVTTAAYDSKQKIWHLDWGEQLNALIDIDDSPLNGDFVTHWMPLPPPPGEEETT